MSEARLEYAKLAANGVSQLRALEHYVTAGSGLEANLLELVRLLASRLNGCEYCVALHTAQLKKMHEPEGRIARVVDWRGSDAYTQRERAALAWTEAVTNIQEGHATDEVYTEVRGHFSDAETANLTLAVATINAWNRMEISLGEFPGHAGGVAE